MMIIRQCKICLKKKPITEYPCNKYGFQGRRASCKHCFRNMFLVSFLAILAAIGVILNVKDMH